MSSKTNHGMTYVCPHCDHRMQTAIPEPRHWPTKHAELDSTHRHLCERCNRFAVPLPYWLAIGQRAWSASIFSNCPNASDCWQHHQYDATCEHGLIQPKCLVAVHGAMNELMTQILALRNQCSGANGPGVVGNRSKP